MKRRHFLAAGIAAALPFAARAQGQTVPLEKSSVARCPRSRQSRRVLRSRHADTRHRLGDPDLMKDKASPYYLGNWFPSEQPGVFFKTVPMKEPFRKVYFAPQTRLPLYQAVFHGCVITTHHWTLDNFKPSNVRVDNELTQLLYNVPPLYNLRSGTAWPCSRPVSRAADRPGA